MVLRWNYTVSCNEQDVKRKKDLELLKSYENPIFPNGVPVRNCVLFQIRILILCSISKTPKLSENSSLFLTLPFSGVRIIEQNVMERIRKTVAAI